MAVPCTTCCRARALLWGQVAAGVLLLAGVLLRLFWLLGQLAAL